MLILKQLNLTIHHTIHHTIYPTIQPAIYPTTDPTIQPTNPPVKGYFVKRLLCERLLKCYFVEMYLMLLCEGEYIQYSLLLCLWKIYLQSLCRGRYIFKAAILKQILFDAAVC